MSRALPTTVAGWCRDAGFSGIDLITAVAVSVAAGSDPAAPGGAFGVGGPPGDGPGQAKAAHDLLGSSGWGAFPTHANGRWLIYQPLAAASIPAGVVTGAVNPLPGVVNPIATAGAILGSLTSDLTWQRILKVVGGFVIMVAGAVALSKQLAFDPTQGSIYRLNRRVREESVLAAAPDQPTS